MDNPEIFAKFHIQKAIRDFFNAQGFFDVLTPPMVSNPGMEVHIQPFKIEKTDLYLHTSPEFAMKELLSKGMEKIFTLSYCFRNEPRSFQHRPQFLMLEWYRAYESYETIMKDCEDLFIFTANYLSSKNFKLKVDINNFKPIRKTVSEIFKEIIQIDILDYLDTDSIRNLIRDSFPDVPLPNEELSWDDYYFLLFLNKVEPSLKEYDFLILSEFPAPLAALSKLKEGDNRVCKRFELYCQGIEIANCFYELTDLEEQKKRFAYQAKLKKDLYNQELPSPDVLYNALEKGLPKSSGIALGVERLLGVLIDIENPFWD